MARRICDYNSFGQPVYCRNRSTWDSWVRWLVLGLIILAFLFFFMACSCITARRRRKAGRQPFYGTGWALGRTAPGHGQPTYSGNNTQPYYNNGNQWTQPAPPYSPPPQAGAQGGYYPPQGANNSYYNQQSGVEMGNTGPNAPQPVYNRDTDATYNGYQPPPGPPPNKA